MLKIEVQVVIARQLNTEARRTSQVWFDQKFNAESLGIWQSVDDTLSLLNLDLKWQLFFVG